MPHLNRRHFLSSLTLLGAARLASSSPLERSAASPLRVMHIAFYPCPAHDHPDFYNDCLEDRMDLLRQNCLAFYASHVAHRSFPVRGRLTGRCALLLDRIPPELFIPIAIFPFPGIYPGRRVNVSIGNHHEVFRTLEEGFTLPDRFARHFPPVPAPA